MAGTPEGPRMSRTGRTSVVAAAGFAAALLFQITPLLVSPGFSAAPLTVAVADFDYIDTSGEVRDQRKEHEARMQRFTELLRESLGGRGDFHVQPLSCTEPPCTPINMQPQKFIDASRRSGARFV